MSGSTSYGIVETIGKAAALEQLAEECAELAQAALKLARIERHQNPTPVKYDEAFTALVEEVGDVRLCIDVMDEALGPIDTTIMEFEKYRRWKKRIKAYYDPDPEPVEKQTK